MYDRAYEEKTLSFEPSGGLLEAALVMRDRETDSWWAILRGRSIGGPMEGRELREIPGGEKATWGDWRRRHPETLVLTVEGRTHVPENRYQGYFSSDRTFRGVKAADQRLPAKEPIFAFRIRDRAYAATHRTAAGGHLASFGDRAAGDATDAVSVFLFRAPGAAVFATTRAWLVPRGLIARERGRHVLRPAAGAKGSSLPLGSVESLKELASRPGVERLVGLDTYWYTWSAVNPGTRLLR